MRKFHELSKNDVLKLANNYGYQDFFIKLENKEFLTQTEFLEIVLWKSKRPKKHYIENDDQFIQEVSKIAFSSDVSERSEKYPIIDFRALWSLYGTNRSEIKYNFNFWDKYRIDCVELAKKHQISLRILDKALWQFSKFYQKDA